MEIHRRHITKFGSRVGANSVWTPLQANGRVRKRDYLEFQAQMKPTIPHSHTQNPQSPRLPSEASVLPGSYWSMETISQPIVTRSCDLPRAVPEHFDLLRSVLRRKLGRRRLPPVKAKGRTASQTPEPLVGKQVPNIGPENAWEKKGESPLSIRVLSTAKGRRRADGLHHDVENPDYESVENGTRRIDPTISRRLWQQRRIRQRLLLQRLEKPQKMRGRSTGITMQFLPVFARQKELFLKPEFSSVGIRNSSSHEGEDSGVIGDSRSMAVTTGQEEPATWLKCEFRVSIQKKRRGGAESSIATIDPAEERCFQQEET